MQLQAGQLAGGLKLVYGIINVGLPTFTAFMIEPGFGYMFLLVSMFIFFMQLLLIPELPDDTKKLAVIVFGPILWMIIPAVVSAEGYSIVDNAMLSGMVYASSMMLSYTLLVCGGPVMMYWAGGEDKAALRTFAFWRGYLLIAIAQLIFIIPGLVSIVIFLQFATTELFIGQWVVVHLGLFAIAVVESIVVLFPAIKQKSILA